MSKFTINPLFNLLTLGLSLLFFASSLYYFYQARIPSSYRTVEGTITAMKYEHFLGVFGPWYKPVVQYEHDKTYTTKIELAFARQRTGMFTNKYVTRYTVGSKVDIAYNQSKPTEAKIIKDSPRIRNTAYLLLIIGALLASVNILSYKKRNK